MVAFLEELATSDDPAQCTTWYTERALEQLTGDTSPKGCIEAVTSAEPATGAEITDVQVDGRRASARLLPEGGDSAGYAMTVDLVSGREGADGWQVDHYRGVEVVDRALIDARYSEVITTIGPSLMAPDGVDCLDARMRAVPDDQVAQAVLDRTTGYTVVDAIRDCVGFGLDLTAILFLSSHQLQQGGLTQGQADCVASLAIVDYEDLTLEEIITSPEAKEQWMAGLKEAAAFGADDVGATSSVCAKA